MKAKWMVGLVLAVALSWMTVATLNATPAMQKKEGKTACTDCHTKAGSKDLTEAGKAYLPKK